MMDHIEAGDVTVGQLLKDPQDRQRSLEAVALMIGAAAVFSWPQTMRRCCGSVIGCWSAGRGYDRRNLDTTLCVPAAAEYVITGTQVGASWIWRTLADR